MTHDNDYLHHSYYLLLDIFTLKMIHFFIILNSEPKSSNNQPNSSELHVSTYLRTIHKLVLIH